jgi:hypothetical protein
LIPCLHFSFHFSIWKWRIYYDLWYTNLKSKDLQWIITTTAVICDFRNSWSSSMSSYRRKVFSHFINVLSLFQLNKIWFDWFEFIVWRNGYKKTLLYTFWTCMYLQKITKKLNAKYMFVFIVGLLYIYIYIGLLLSASVAFKRFCHLQK